MSLNVSECRPRPAGRYAISDVTPYPASMGGRQQACRESGDPVARRPALDATPPRAGPAVARVKRRMLTLSLVLGAGFALPVVIGALRAWSRGEPGVGWLAGGIAALLGPGAAWLALRHAILPEIDALERTRAEPGAPEHSASVAARDTNHYLRDVSHELRATMHAVLGLTQLLSRSPLDATQHRQTRTIDGAARVLLRIINDLLAFSGPEPHRFEVVPMGCSLQDLLRVSIDLLEPSATDKGLGLELHVAPDLPDRVLIDVGRVQQIVLGVCRYAIETHEHGPLRIDVRAKHLGDKRFEMSLSIQAPEAPAARPAAERAAPRPASDAPELRPASPSGRALDAVPASQGGLSLSRRLAALMGGSVRLGGSPRGIELLLPVPRVDGIPEAPARGQRAAPPPPAMIRLPATGSPILLIEADRRAQITALELLENLGFDVEVTDSAGRALERVERERYSLILLATELPGDDGYAAAARLRQRLGARPAIVGCTDRDLEAARARPDSAAFDTLLSKPLDRTALCAALIEWVPDESQPASSGTRLSQSGALTQATRRAFAAKASAPPAALPDLAPGQRSVRLLELLVLEAPAQVRTLVAAATDGRRDEVAAIAERLAARCAGAGAVKLAALCRSLSGASELSLDRLRDSAQALERALDALLVALGEPAASPESASASGSSDRNPESL
jgi:signal transduction histidine kinase/CheY-like chemotaxis protein